MIVLERSRRSAAGPSSRYGTIASSTVTLAIVSFGRCGLVTLILISPGLNSTRRTLNLIQGRWRAADEVQEGGAGRREQCDDAGEKEQRNERPKAPVARLAPLRGGRGRRHQSITSKKPIQPSSVNSDWWAWNMKRPVFAKSISMMPRCPWQSMTVSVYSK